MLIATTVPLTTLWLYQQIYAG